MDRSVQSWASGGHGLRHVLEYLMRTKNMFDGVVLLDLLVKIGHRCSPQTNDVAQKASEVKREANLGCL